MRNVRRNDWVGFCVSLLTHALLVVLLSFITTGASEPQPIGFIEVDFGPFADGRPVQRSRENLEQDVPAADLPPVEEQAESLAPDEARPTDVPDQRVEDEEVITSSNAETISPRTETNPDDAVVQRPTPRSQRNQPTGAGLPDGTGAATTGEQGTGTDERKAAPFQIEGLNRIPVSSSIPAYSEQVNAVIRVRITVDPQGHVVQRIPLLKGNPALERSVMETLSTWRFNPLPPNAPQENQVGTVTFRFMLE